MSSPTRRLEGGAQLAALQLGEEDHVASLKMHCALQLNDYIDSLHWTQERIGRELGLSQPHVSELRNFALDRFSSDRLLQFMVALGLDVSIRIERPAGDGAEGGPVVTIKVPAGRKKSQRVA